jgi:hypothetical protein
VRISYVALLVAAGLTVVGCAEEPSPPAPLSTATESATPTPTPSPTVATKPALADLVVYPGGIDYVKVGVPVEPRADDLAVVRYNANGCTSEPSRIIGWESTYGPDSFEIVSNPDETIRGVWVRSPQIHTASGIHKGSTVDEVVAAYGGGVTVTEAQVTDLYSVSGPDGMVVFEVATERDFEGGDYGAHAGTVLWMLILPPGSEPFSIAYGAYGPCV